jgi:hypothetical protein
MAQDSGAQSTDSKSDPFAGAVETTDNFEDPFAADGAELSENSEPPEESDESDDWGDDDDGFGDFGGDPFGESNEGAASSAGSGPVVAPAVLPAPSSLLNKKNS